MNKKCCNTCKEYWTHLLHRVVSRLRVHQHRDEIVDTTDLVSTVSHYIPLKKKGKVYKARCPFCRKRSFSFTVHPERQIFHCFACGEGGDAAIFLEKHLQIRAEEARKMVEKRPSDSA